MNEPLWIPLEEARADELNGTEIVVLHKGAQRIGQMRTQKGKNGTYAVELHLGGREHDRAWFLQLYLDADQVSRIEPLPALNEDDPKWIMR